MSTQVISNVRIAGVSAAVPKQTMRVEASAVFSSSKKAKKYIDEIGIEELHLHDGDMTSSDLCQAAAERLMAELGWSAKDVDLLIFVSQERDYVLPATACILHGKMGMRKECAALDMPMGCSGWVYGLSVAAGMMQAGGFSKALLLAGEAAPMGPKHPVRSDMPLFGDAGTATALVYDENASKMVIDTYTDGTGYEAIIRRSGGERSPLTRSALVYKEDKFGRVHRAIDKEMDGAAVFVFAISQVPKAVKSMLEKTGQKVEDVDYFLFHQASLLMNEQVRRKCCIPADKCPYSLRDFGNNSSASIPLTIVTQMRDALAGCVSPQNVIACGFGVGLSWATANLQFDSLVIPSLIEL